MIWTASMQFEISGLAMAVRAVRSVFVWLCQRLRGTDHCCRSSVSIWPENIEDDNSSMLANIIGILGGDAEVSAELEQAGQNRPRSKLWKDSARSVSEKSSCKADLLPWLHNALFTVNLTVIWVINKFAGHVRTEVCFNRYQEFVAQKC